MPGAADFIQRTIHRLETGDAVVWIKRTLAVVAFVSVTVFYFLHEFNGLATSQAMDQAQIGRNIARGQLWKTAFLRPLAAGQLQRAGRNVANRIWHDTYNAPLPPLVNAFVLLPFKRYWVMTSADVIHVGDRAIAIAALGLFFASLAVLYLTARRLFDARLALLASGLVLVGDIFWKYSLSGLPQMLMLLLFSGTLYFLTRAIEAQYRGEAVGLWLGATGFGFGLLALAHALTIWIFLGALLVSAFFFRPRGWAAAIVLGVFLAAYSPWLVRNTILTGNPAGVAAYAIFDDIKHPEAGHMRRMELDLDGVGPGYFRVKLAKNFREQGGRLLEYFGWSVVALIFFVAFLHIFKRPETAMLRWMILAMWGGGMFGMVVYGMPEEQGVSANQLHLLFIPIMTCYGLAYLLVQWNRLDISYKIARTGFLSLLFLLCALPMLLTLASPKKADVRWPPYIPPYISVLNKWMEPHEIIASDMPWAIAWYADRRGLWVPDTIKTFTDLHDYETFGGPLNGLYLTPISGSTNTLSNITRGEYRDWAPMILRTVDLTKFPLKWATLLGLDDEAVFFSDHDRQRIPVKR